jgi:Spy/CpxP family protein refolding chaperone
MVRHFRILGVSALVVALVSGGALAYAQGPEPGGPRGRGPGFGGPGAGLSLRALDLTDAQQEQVRQLTQQNREQIRSLMDRMRVAQEARRKAVEAIPFNESQVRAAMKDVAEAEADLAVAEARLQADIYALLSADQQQRLQKLRAERVVRAKERAQQQQQRLQQRQQRQARPQA